MTKRARILFLCASCALVLLILAGALMGGSQDQDRAYSSLKTFTQSLRLVERHYVDEVDMARAMKGAYRGLVERLDPFSSYLRPEEVQRIAALEGDADVGIYLVRGASGFVRVASVRHGSPAWEEGIRPGRWIEVIEGRPTRDITLLEAQMLLRGKEDSTVSLSFFEGDREEREELTLTRRRFESHLVQEEVDPEAHPGTAHVRLLDLGPGTADELAALLRGFTEEGVRHLILDLRTNAGGREKEAMAVADLLLDEGEMLEVYARGEDPVRTYEATKGTLFPGDVTVLVGTGTVGEAEALAAALKVNERAELMGTRTLGKALIQEFITFEDGTAVYLSVEEYRGPGGLAFNGEGVKPDTVVAESLEEGEDAVLDAALNRFLEVEKPAEAAA